MKRVQASKLAKISGLNIRLIQRWCSQGRLPAKKLGSRWYIDLDKLRLSEDSGLSELAMDVIIAKIAESRPTRTPK